MRIISQAVTVIFLSGIMGGMALAQPPSLNIPTEIEAKGDYVTLTPESDAKAITYLSCSGVDSFPSDLLKDGKSFVLPVRGLKEGKYKFTAIAIKDNEYTIKDFYVRVGKSPDVIPDIKPNPEPQPKPDPELDDAPVQSNGLHVAMIYESGQRVTQDQFNSMYGQTIRGWLDTNCDKKDGTSQYRILDQDSVATVEIWKDILKRERKSIPWIVIISGKKYVYEGALPGPTELIKILEKYKPKTVTNVIGKKTDTTPTQTKATPEVVAQVPFRETNSRDGTHATTVPTTAPIVEQRNIESRVMGQSKEHTYIPAQTQTVVPYGITNGRYVYPRCTSYG